MSSRLPLSTFCVSVMLLLAAVSSNTAFGHVTFSQKSFAQWPHRTQGGGNNKRQTLERAVDSTTRFLWAKPTSGDDTLHFAIEIDAAVVNNTGVGWIAFGLGEPITGGLVGADVALIEHLGTPAPTIRDTWTPRRAAPVDDPPYANQNWVLTSTSGWASSVINQQRVYTVTLSRKFTQGIDPEWDRPILNNSVADKFWIMYGDSSTINYVDEVTPIRYWRVDLFATADQDDEFREMTLAPGVRATRKTFKLAHMDAETKVFYSPFWLTSELFHDREQQGQKGARPFFLGMRMGIVEGGGNAHHWILLGQSAANTIPTALFMGVLESDVQYLGMPPGYGNPAAIGYSLQVHVLPHLFNKTVDFTFYWKYAVPDVTITSAQNMNLGPVAPGTPLLLGNCTLTIIYDSQCTRKYLKRPVTIREEAFHGHSKVVTFAVSYFRNATSSSIQTEGLPRSPNQQQNGSVTHHRQNNELNRVWHTKAEYPDYAIVTKHRLPKPFIFHPGDHINVSCRYFTTKPTNIGHTHHDEMCLYFGVFSPSDAYTDTPFFGMNTCRRIVVEPGYTAEMARREDITPTTTANTPTTAIDNNTKKEEVATTGNTEEATQPNNITSRPHHDSPPSDPHLLTAVGLLLLLAVVVVVVAVLVVAFVFRLPRRNINKKKKRNEKVALRRVKASWRDDDDEAENTEQEEEEEEELEAEDGITEEE